MSDDPDEEIWLIIYESDENVCGNCNGTGYDCGEGYPGIHGDDYGLYDDVLLSVKIKKSDFIGIEPTLYKSAAPFFTHDDANVFPPHAYPAWLDSVWEGPLEVGVTPGMFVKLKSVKTISAYYFADLNGDGKTDILLIQSDSNAYIYYANSSGTGFNNPIVITNLFGMNANAWNATQRKLFINDFNNDGKNDILLEGKDNAFDSYLLIANDDGGFNNRIDITNLYGMDANAWAANHRVVSIGDFNGDGKADILLQGVSSSYGTILLMANDSGGFSRVDNFTVSYGMTADMWAVNHRVVHISDFNNDSRADILLQGTSSDCGTILLMANASGGFNRIDNFTNSYGMTADMWAVNHRDVHIGDFNGDGKSDILVDGVYNSLNSYLLIANDSGGFNNRVEVTDLFYAE